MKYCRFLLDGQTHYGAVEDRAGEPWIVDLTRAPDDDLAFRLEHGRATSWSFNFEPMPLSATDLLPPVTPSKDHLCRAQLSRPCEGARQRSHPLSRIHFLQTAVVAFGAGRNRASASCFRRG
jgi:hypothetical protein